MSNTLISLMLAAGGAAWVYSKMSRRLGYGNTQTLWIVVGTAFLFVFLFFLTLLHYVIHLNS